MMRNTGEVEQAVSRTLRDNLEKLQRMSEELNQAVNDLVSACASTRPSNSLPPMLRAQTAAASLAASLDVLSRFVTAALQPALRSPAEQQAVEMARQIVSPEISEPAPVPSEPAAELQPAGTAIPVVSETMMESQPRETVAELQASDMIEEGAPAPVVAEAEGILQAAPEIVHHALELGQVPAMPLGDLPPAAQPFDVSKLAVEEQELHRRANRVAKVSMQDIKMLRPNDVALGLEHKDICQRLRDDIERAHKEYDRRFQSILGHPVDYFYDWMVEILGDGNPEALGEYPYPSPVLRH